jgi:hypothetical protein
MRFNYTSYDDLPTRAKNIVDGLGGMGEALEFFKKYKSFLKVQNTGNKTNLELISLCEHLIVEENLINHQESVEVQAPKIPCNIQDLVDFYAIKKLSVTTRLVNYLNKIEDISYFSSGLEAQTNFILHYFLEDFNFMNAEYLGVKSVAEVEKIRDDLRLRAIYNENLTIDNLVLEEDLSKIIYRKFSFVIPIEEIDKAISDNRQSYELPILFKFYLKHQKFRDRFNEALNLLYFSDKRLDNETISTILNYTKERVRQLKRQFIYRILPDEIDFILSTLDGVPYKITSQNNYFIELFDNSTVDDELFFNAEFLKIIITHIYKDSYFDIEELIEDSKSFQSSDNKILIDSKFSKAISFIDLLSFLDSEIYNFETIQFEYDRKILIQRFYDENDLAIEDSDLLKVSDLIDKIVRTEWTIHEASLKRLQKRKEKDEIYDLVHQFISDKKEPQKTKAINEYLSFHSKDISKEFLLYILNKNNNRFQRVGNGYWSITELDKNVHGSIREIIAQKLFESEVPLHISEIHKYINSLRPITEHSLRVNLKVEEDKIFIFFNCSFIGLSAKVYDSYWYNLPKSIASTIRSIFTSKLHFNSESDKISYFSKLYNYPETHLKYLFNSKGKL